MSEPPILSIAIPTYNRADILEYCIDRHLAAFRTLHFPYEIVVSDNASIDHTITMVQSRIDAGAPIRLHRRDKTDAMANIANAFHKCRGRFLTYLADDDAIDADSLCVLVDQLLADSSCVGLYTDWIAFDDDRGEEIHRYYQPGSAARFESGHKHEFVNHVLAHRILPEIGVWRRSAFLQACTATKLQYPFLAWAYGLLDSGAIEFCNKAFYRENRVLKKSLNREQTVSSGWALGMIGDPMRMALENFVCMLMLDSGTGCLTDSSASHLRGLFDGWIHSRVALEISRALQRHDFIAAVELRRRLSLWYGPADTAHHLTDAANVTVPAALQQLHELRLSLSGVTHLAFVGESLKPFAEYYRRLFPSHGADTVLSPLPLEPSTTLAVSSAHGLQGVLDRFHEYPGHVVDLLTLINYSRVGFVPALRYSSISDVLHSGLLP